MPNATSVAMQLPLAVYRINLILSAVEHVIHCLKEGAICNLQ